MSVVREVVQTNLRRLNCGVSGRPCRQPQTEIVRERTRDDAAADLQPRIVSLRRDDETRKSVPVAELEIAWSAESSRVGEDDLVNHVQVSLEQGSKRLLT